MTYTKDGEPMIGKIVGHIAGLIVLLVIVFESFGSVPSGYVGVKTQFSKVIATVQPGFYFKLPFIQAVTQMDVQTQKYQADATAASNDLQSVTATVAVNYHVEPQDASVIYANVGTDYANRVISPAIQESIKSVTANYSAQELITKREQVREDIIALLSGKLQTYGVQTDSLNIVNFKFSDQFETAIEAKVTAVQNADAAKNKLAQVQYEAQQRVAEADGEAKAISIQAQAIQQQGGSAYIQLKAIEKWNGVYPSTYFAGQGATPLINIGK